MRGEVFLRGGESIFAKSASPAQNGALARRHRKQLLYVRHTKTGRRQTLLWARTRQTRNIDPALPGGYIRGRSADGSLRGSEKDLLRGSNNALAAAYLLINGPDSVRTAY